MSPKFASDHSSSSGEPREELAAIIENSRATVDRLKRIIASQHQLLEIEKDLPARHDDSETCRESTHTVINRLEEHRRELDSLNAELGKYIDELGRRAGNPDATDLKRAEEALKLTQASIDLAVDEIIWITPEGKIVYANEATCRALQRSRDELLGMYVWDIQPKYTRETWHEHWQEIKERGSFTFETIHYAKGGREFPVEVSMNYAKSDGKEFNFAYIKDITERKQAEEALRVSEEKYRELVENANSIILRFDMHGNLTFFNEYAEKLFGYSKDEVLGRDVMCTIVPLSESTGRNLNKIMEEMKRCPERYHSNINENICKNGDRVWIAWTNKAIRDEHGNVVEILSVGNDITEQKRMEDALRESEEKLRLAIDGAQMGIWDWNIESDVLVWSDRCKQIVGISPDVALNYGVFLGAIHPEDRERIDRKVKEALTNKEDYDVELRIPWHDGTVHWAACRGRGIYDKAGKAIRMIGMAVDITDPKRAIEALRVSEERLRRASRAGRIGLYEWNEDQGTVYLSPEAYELFGLEPGSMVTPEKFFARVHPDDRETFMHSSAEARKKAHDGSSASAEGEFRVVHEDRSVLWLEATATYDLEGGDLIVRGAVRDITERKRVEDALRVSEERLRRASRAGQTGLYEWNVDHGTAYLSPEAYELYGLEPGFPVTYVKWLATVHPDDRVMVERTIAVARGKARDTSSVSTHVEFRALHPGGTVLWLLVTATCSIEGGDLIARGAVRDITERKLAEKELRMNKEKFRVLADTSFGLIAVHIGDKLLYVNDQAIPLTGYTKDELLNRSFWEIFKEDYRELIKKRALDRLAGKPGPANYEAKILTKDGKIKWVNMTAGLFLYEDKPAIITTLFDITDSKNAERELKEAKAQAELYLDLMGHDINNFNLVARGYLELMDGMTDDEKLKELVFKPMEAIDSSSRLIQNVQKLQREKSGEYMREVLDLGTLVEEVAGQMESAPYGHMYINCGAVKGVHVQADELLRDVFVNLVGNAIKHSAESPQIDIRMVPEKKDGREYCRVIIDDNGPGVPDDMKEKIFNRLRRGNTKAKGSGLGLYLVKSLVESYGGKVWVEDKVKGDQTKGARFVVELPVV